MKKLIVIKYGELSTKKDNINFFLKTLRNNIDYALKDINHEIKYDHGRMYIDVAESDLEASIDILKKVFGIHEIVIGYIIDTTDFDEIKTNLEKLIEDEEFSTFKVETKRVNKDYPLTSPEISKQLGAVILKKKKVVKVDVHDPEIVVNVEIRLTETLIYLKGIPGCGGYPVSTLGKGLLMLSGGIDSPVAGYLAMKRGVKLECLYFESPPHTSEAAKEKVMDLAKVLSKCNNDIKVHIINFTKIQEEILKNIPHEYLITIMRRMMYRISEEISRKINAKIIVNGESIGQVASQTLTSMNAINRVVKMPVIRPVACLDKLEIIDISKKIGTYDISIRPFEDCCTIFVPKHPVINPNAELCEEYEKLIPYEEYIKEAVRNHEVIKLSSIEGKFQDLL